MTAAHLDIAAYKRVPFKEDIAIAGPDWSGATFAMQIRQHWGDTGTALLTPSLVATYVPDYVYYDERKRTDIIGPATVLTMSISEAAIEALPLAASEQKPLELVYDVHVTPPGETKAVLLKGAFVIFPGATL